MYRERAEEDAAGFGFGRRSLGLAAALAAARAGARVTVLERNAKPGKKLLATGNGRCNLDNTGIAPERYFTSDPAGLKPLLAAVNAADPLGWFESLGLYTRTDEAGRVYPYSNQAADVFALLEHHLEKIQRPHPLRVHCPHPEPEPGRVRRPVCQCRRPA